MLNIKKILLPVDFPNPSLRVIHQAATLARHFHSEIVMLHVATALSHIAGVPESGPELARWDMLAEMSAASGKNPGRSLVTDLDGLIIRRVLAKGNTTRAIVQTAQEQQVDLIMMPSHGHTFDEFLLGSVTAKGQRGNECPIWTDPHVEELRTTEFAIRSVLCALDLNPHDRKTASWAAQIAAAFGAHLTLAHVTAPVELWGPGGSYIDVKWKKALVADASHRIAKLQQDIAIKADVFIGSGDAPKILCQAAKLMTADLLVIGCQPYGGNLRTHGFGIICAVPIPVVSV